MDAAERAGEPGAGRQPPPAGCAVHVAALRVTGLDRRHTTALREVLAPEDGERATVLATVVHLAVHDPAGFIEAVLDRLDPQWRALDALALHARLAEITGPRRRVVLLLRVRARILHALARRPQP
ncbi:hypothetical protein KDK95_29375 [Actinospica sp. MGRD01-02]|uniref:Uncharacterized protein n=1 Tax=Actinospica acidithermotolerans TaxID=2828514 RepID=A0A941EHE6_9ACTN|nr:hypothetical protein [Actinospica acidithermotolerans]MBR7830448.1 hypothetical protein [Actinospica acidithermotolerans]